MVYERAFFVLPKICTMCLGGSKRGNHIIENLKAQANKRGIFTLQCLIRICGLGKYFVSDFRFLRGICIKIICKSFHLQLIYTYFLHL